MTIKKLALKGIKWTAASQLARIILQYLTTFILVKLLSPSDYGLMAMSVIVIGFLEIFKDLGTSSALIQQKKINDALLNSVFWLNLFFGAAITFLLFFSADLIALFYNEPRLTSILQVLSITFFISSIGIVHKTLLEKNLNFDFLAKIEVISSFLSSIVGITMALLGYGVWSLVFQSLVNTLGISISLWLFYKWKPRFVLKLSEISKIVKYSSNLIGFNIVNYGVRNADYLLIGKFLGDVSLGHYYLAYRIMLYPLQNITAVISRVLFPVYSEIQDDNAKFRFTYLTVAKAIAIITFPMMFGIMGVSDSFVKVFFSEKWNSELLIILLIIFSPLGLIQSVSSTVGLIYQAKGRTDMMFKWSLFAGIVFITAFIIGLKWGVLGVALSYFISYLLVTYPSFAIPFKLIELKFSFFISNLYKIFLSGFVMYVVVFIFSLFFNGVLSDVYILLLSIIIGVFIFIFMSYFINKRDTLAFLKMLKEGVLQRDYRK